MILALVAVLGSLPIASRAQPAAPQLFLRGDFLVDVSRASEYEAAVKDLRAELAKNGFPFQIDVYSTDDGHYYADVPLRSHADADSLLAAWRDLRRKMGDQGRRALLDRIAAYEIERIFQSWLFRPGISFLPEPERLRPAEIDYYTWDYVWIIPGREAEFESCNRDWIALSKAKGARDPFFTFEGSLGVKTPVYVWVEYGKSAADYAVTEEAFWNLLGDEGAALSKRTRAVIRTRESKTGRRRADLSYKPKS